MKAERIFTPYHIGNCEIPNRLVVPAMVANMCPDGNAPNSIFAIMKKKQRAAGD